MPGAEEETYGKLPLRRGALRFYAVNVTCLDDVTAKELDAALIRYEDGRNNDWASAPSEWRYL